MSAFIELRVVGDSRAFIEAGSIAGLMTAEGGRVDVVATPEKPLLVILRGGETIKTFGESAGMLLIRAGMVKKQVREQGLDIKCNFVDPTGIERDEDEANPVPVPPK